MKRIWILGALLLALAPNTALARQGVPAVLAKMDRINAQLRARGLNLAIEQIEFYTIGGGRPANRIHRQQFRWAAGDTRRLADGNNITYLVSPAEGDLDGATASGVAALDSEAAVDRALQTWDDSRCFRKVDLVKRPYTPGEDVTIFDSFFVDPATSLPFGGLGNPFLADIVNAGFWPRAFFEAVGGPGGGRGILAFSVSFIFVDAAGNPTDINGDRHLDTALNEVYYNDTFGDPADDRAGNPWGIEVPLPGIDIETVALHENGHSLGVGHFGPPPRAVMNPVYGGIRHAPLPVDNAGMCGVWARWPN